MTAFELRPPECTNLHGQDTGRDHLSDSSLTTLLACEARFDFHYEQRLAPAVTATPLALGRAFAEALEAGDPDIGAGRVLLDHEQEVEANQGNPWVVVRSREEAEIGATTVRAAARAYLNRYGSHHETRELELRARIRNPQVGGRVSQTHDILARVDAVDLDNRVLVEDKFTSSMMRTGLDRRVRLDRQVTIGAYLIWRCTGVEISEIRYRAALKPGIRRRQGETHEGFLERLDRDYDERPDHYLVEEIAHRDLDDFLRLERELWRWAEQVRSARADGVWPRNVSACFDYGGCRYAPLCCGEPGASEQFVVRPARELATNEPVEVQT